MDNDKKGLIDETCVKRLLNLLLLSNIVNPRKLRASRELNSYGFNVQL